MLLNSKEIAEKLNSKWIKGTDSTLPEFFNSSKISTDSRKCPEGALFFALKGEKYDGHDFISDAVKSGAGALCISKQKSHLAEKFSIPFLPVENTESAYRKIASLNREKSNAKLIAITGTCGKTSTKEFLSKILSESCGQESVLATRDNTNNLIGVPQNLLRLNQDHKFAVIEMGTNKIGEIETLTLCAKPDMAIVTSIGRGHIEFLKNIEGVAKEESSVFRGLKKGGIAIIPHSCEFRNILVREAKKNASEIFSFSCDENANCEIRAKPLKNTLYETEVELYLKNSDEKKILSLPVPGIHQISNALAALLCSMKLGVQIAPAVSALQSASVCGMRMRRRILNGILFINDAYNSNPESARAALEWLSQASPNKENLFIFLGDMLELGADAINMHCEILSLASSLFPNSTIITVGPLMAQAVSRIKNQKIITFKTSKDAANFAKSKLEKGHIALIKGSRGMAMEEIEKICEE